MFCDRSNLDNYNSISQLGGKGFNLIKMQKNGLLVPDFFVIPVVTTQEILNPIQHEINSLLEGLAIGNLANIKLTSKEIQQLIINLNLDSAFFTAINAKCKVSFGENYQVSARSSSVDEDGDKFSFAGIHNSYLGVSELELIQKTKECLASFYSVSSLTYRLKHNLNYNNISSAIIIQKMVHAVKSGVAFSMNIHGNLNDMLIVAGYGLGEGIVSDKVETDSFFINRNNLEISQEVSLKQNKLVLVNHKLIEAEIEKEQQLTPALNRDEIIKITEKLRKTESLLGTISDMEYCIDSENNLFILQMRPITAVKQSKFKILDNTNISESYPEVNLPLTISFAKENYKKVFEGAAKGFKISKKSLKSYDNLFNSLVDSYYGRMYYRLDNWYKIIATVSSSKKSIQAWEKAVGLAGGNQVEVQSISFYGKLKIYIKILWLLLNYKKGNNRFFILFNTNYKELGRFKEFKESPKELINHYELVSNKIVSFWYLTLINDLITFKSFGWLQNTLKKHSIGNDNLSNDLISGLINSDSQKAFKQVLFIKSIIQANKNYTTIFNEDSKEIIKKLNTKECSDLKVLIDNYIAKYGDRVLAELKLENDSFRENKEAFILLIKKQLLSKISIEDIEQKQKELRETAIVSVKASLNKLHPARVMILFYTKLAAYGVRNRENMRFCRAKLYGTTKEIYKTLGSDMKTNNYLEEERDVFYLTTEQVKNYCYGNKDENIKQKVNDLKNEYSIYNQIEVPDRIIYMGNSPLTLNRKNRLANSFSNKLVGTPVSDGEIIGEAIVINSPNFSLDVSGKILITKITDPGWVFLMTQAIGLVSEKGSLLSHTAIVGRELGIPVIVGMENVLNSVKTGDTISINGKTGELKVLKSSI